MSTVSLFSFYYFMIHLKYECFKPCIGMHWEALGEYCVHKGNQCFKVLPLFCGEKYHLNSTFVVRSMVLYYIHFKERRMLQLSKKNLFSPSSQFGKDPKLKVQQPQYQTLFNS